MEHHHDHDESENQSLKIIFQNEFFVAVDKPHMSLTVPGREGDKDPRPVVGLQLQNHLEKQVFPIHRLDFGVSGIVLFAIDAGAHKAANKWFESRETRKSYEALTEKIGDQDPKEGTWKSKLVRGKKRVFEADHGQESITEAYFLEQKGGHYLWNVSPITGRSHQLRYELSKHGFPILGDVLYGAKEPWGHGIALRAVSLEFLNDDFKKFGLPKKLRVEPLLLF